MAKTVANIRSGPGTLYYAASTVALPALENVAGGILTDAMFTTATYTSLGYTESGVNIEITTDVFKHEVDEAVGVVGGTVQAISGQVSFTMAEADVDAFALAVQSATKTTVAAGATQAGLTKLVWDMDNSLDFLRLAHLSTLNGKSFLHAIWKVAAEGTVSPAYKKGDKTLVDVTFAMYENPEASPAEERFYSIREYTAAPSA
jgi:hypothetical protein